MKTLNLIRHVIHAIIALSALVGLLYIAGCAKRTNDPVIRILSDAEASQARKSVFGG